MNLKPSNPKDGQGIKKVGMSAVPAPVLAEIALGMMEGARKYGRHNYRAIGVRSSVYYDAAMRHLFAWWEGQDIDPDSGLSHITKCITSLVVLRDAMMQDNLTDDRPIPAKDVHWISPMNDRVEKLIQKYPTSAPDYTRDWKQGTSINDHSPQQDFFDDRPNRPIPALLTDNPPTDQSVPEGNLQGPCWSGQKEPSGMPDNVGKFLAGYGKYPAS